MIDFLNEYYYIPFLVSLFFTLLLSYFLYLSRKEVVDVLISKDELLLKNLELQTKLNQIPELEAKIADLEKTPKPSQTFDAAQLLHELTKGTAVVKIIPLDASQLFLRSPRG